MHRLLQISFFIILSFIKINAQSFDKKYTTTLPVDKTISIALKTSNTSIKVVTWNKSKVAVNAVITVSGLQKLEAEKYLNNWKINVSGNTKKVTISTKGDYGLGIKNEVIVFNTENNFEEVSIQQWRDSLKNVKHKSLKIFNRLQLSKEYQKRIKKNQKKQEKYYKKSQRKGIKNVVDKPIDSIILDEIIDKKIKFYTKKIKKHLSKNHSKKYKKTITKNIFSSGVKKVVIKKRITLFVPKHTKINFNTRYCNISVPSIIVKGKVFYGNFNALELLESNLKIQNANVEINKIVNSKIILQNIKNANINLIDNTTLKSNSTNLVVGNVTGNVYLDSSFGKLWILKIDTPIQSFNLNLNNSEAILNVEKLRESLVFGEKKNLSKTTLLSTEKNITLKGKMKVFAPKFLVEGKFSTLTIH